MAPHQYMSEMKSRHLFLGQQLGRFPMDVASRTHFANLFWGILVMWLNKRS